VALGSALNLRHMLAERLAGEQILRVRQSVKVTRCGARTE
jgi:hypothetical protein